MIVQSSPERQLVNAADGVTQPRNPVRKNLCGTLNARQRHVLHHDQDINNLEADHFWNRGFIAINESCLPARTAKQNGRSRRPTADYFRRL